MIELARRSWLSAFAQTLPFPIIADWVASDRLVERYRQYWPDMLVLEQAGALLGLVQPKDAEINGLWVHPSHQGTGAGTELLRAGERVIAGAGHRIAWLTCSVVNRRALAFYERRGYLATGREVSVHPTGIEIVDVRMERTLA